VLHREIVECGQSLDPARRKVIAENVPFGLVVLASLTSTVAIA
jgi:hypothetical protein